MTDHDQNAQPCDRCKRFLAAGLIAGALSQEQQIAALRAERDAALARVKEVEGELKTLKESEQSIYKLWRDTTAAAGACGVKFVNLNGKLVSYTKEAVEAEQQRDALKADNERLRGLLRELSNQTHELIKQAKHFASEDLAAPAESHYLWCAIDDTEGDLEKADKELGQ